MIFQSGTNTEQLVETVDYGGDNPRCSLDFYIELDDGTVIGDTVLRLQQFSGQESLSQMFEFNLTLHANTFTSSGVERPWGELQAGTYGTELAEGGATSNQINFKKILGAKACIRLGLPETSKDVSQNSYPDERPVVYFNGIISSFAMTQRGVYQAVLKPALFKLSLQNNYRLFSQMTILDVIMQVLSENNIDFNRSDLEQKPNKVIRGLANYRKQDWLQAGETDLDFINRLMQKVNLFFYFVHDDSSHEMIIADQPVYQSIYTREISADGHNEETDQLKTLFLSYTHQASLDRDDYITQFNYQQNLTTSGISTVLAQKEATWESEDTAQVSPVYLNLEHSSEKMNMEILQMVQFGASEKESEAITNSAMSKLLASRFSFSGSSTCPELKAGHKFNVQQAEDPSTDSNYNMPIAPTLEDQEFVVTSVQHTGDAAGSYSNQFQAVDAGGLALPFQAGQGDGSILAQVVDNSAALAADSEQQTEVITHQGSGKKYLEKDSFTFDSKDFYYDDSGEQSVSCRGIYVIFIDQPDNSAPQWVKLAEHMQTIPERGSYVTVGRSTDENEIPEVQQSLQAKGSKVIMPKDYTTNTNVGNSYGTSYGDSTNISFGADVTTALSTAKDIVETQRNSKHYNSVGYSESSSYSYSVTPHSHNISRMGDGADLDADPSDKNDYISYSNSAMYGDSYSKSLQTGKSTNYSTQSGGTFSDSTVTGGSTSISYVDTSNSTSTVDTSISDSTVTTSISNSNVTTSISSSWSGFSKSSNTVGFSLSDSVTGMSIGAQLTGMSINSSLTTISASTGLTLISGSMNITAVSSSMGITGSSSGMNITGSSTSMNITGQSNGMNITGQSNTMNITGQSNTINLTGQSNSVDMWGAAAKFENGPAATELKLSGPELKILSSIMAVL